MTRAKGFAIGQWIGYIVGTITIVTGVSKCVNNAVAYNNRLKAVEVQVVPIKRISWDMQILMGDAQSRNPARYDSLIHVQTIVNGPRPEIKESP